MPGLKIGNEYKDLFPNYTDTPKAVIAAIAYSFALRLTGDACHAATKLCENEWKTLHLEGIVPQKPKGKSHDKNK